MTVDNKAFKVKNGLVVQGSSATVAGNEVLTTASDLDDLNNVNAPTPTDGDALIYDADTQTWIPAAGGAGSEGPPGIVAQPEAPASTDILWLDTDADAAIPSVGSMGGYESQTYYTPVHIASASGATATQNTTYYSAFYVSETATFDRIACRAATGFSGTATVRLGIYNNGTNAPTTVVLDAGTVSVTAAGTFEITISQQLTPGWYWLAFNSQTNATTNTFSFISPVPTWGYIMTTSALNRLQGRVQTGVTGAFATATGLDTGSTLSVATVLLRKA